MCHANTHFIISNSRLTCFTHGMPRHALTYGVVTCNGSQLTIRGKNDAKIFKLDFALHANA